MSTSRTHTAANGNKGRISSSSSRKNFSKSSNSQQKRGGEEKKKEQKKEKRQHKVVDLFANPPTSFTTSTKEKQNQVRENQKGEKRRKEKSEDPELKKRVAPMLGLDPEGSWNVVSSLEGLVMIHADPEADLQYYRYLRGVVVDLASGQIVCSSYPTTPSYTLLSLSSSFSPSSNNQAITQEQNTPRQTKLKLSENVEVDLSKFRFKIGFEGTLIHVFKVNGKVYRVTRKRLDPSRSKWGNSKNFSEMYWELNGPADEVLFSPDKDYSPFCHSFIMVHPDVTIASRETFSSSTSSSTSGQKKGYLVYLGVKQMYSLEKDCPYPLDKVDQLLRLPEITSVHPSFSTVSTENQENSNGRIYCPENLSVEEANKHLLFGYYSPFEGYENLDPRLLPGEFIIMENTETGEMYRIESVAYSWRYKMRNNNPNLLHRFYELLDFAYLKNLHEDNVKYTEMFPLLTKYTQSELNNWINNSGLVLWPQETERIHEIPKNRDDKLYNIWMCMLCAVPVHQQKDVLPFYDIFMARREQLTNWFISLSNKYSSCNLSLNELKEKIENEILPSGVGYSRRAKDILVKTRQFAEERVARGDNVVPGFDTGIQEAKSVEQLTHENIRNFLGKEVGASLYRLLKEMDLYNNPPLVPRGV